MTPLEASRFTDRDLIEKIVESYYIVDHGFISKVNTDNTVDVVHSKKEISLDGQELPETETKRVEVLSFSCGEFSVQVKPKKGDNVLLLGLKNYVKHAGGVSQASKNEVFLHYQQNTMKAVPLSLFDDNAKVKIEIDDGNLALVCKKFIVKGSNGQAALEVTP